MTAFISPLLEGKQQAKVMIGQDDMVEIYCDCPLEICEKRDVKGFSQKARAGLIQEYTGISSPYEKSECSVLRLRTGIASIDDCVEEVIHLLQTRNIISQKQELR